MQGHIDKLTKNIQLNIDKKPVGAIQWDFICSIPEARDSMIKNYENGPESIYLYLTSKCNRKCNDCPNTSVNELKLEDVKYIIEKQKKKRLKYIILDGDPFQYNQLKEVIDIINKNHIAYSINTYSQPSEEILNYIKSSVAKIQFKMNSIEYSTYVDCVIKTLEKCKEKDIYTAIIFTINEKNVKNIKQMIEFCKDYSVKQFSFLRLNICYMKKNKKIDKRSFLQLSKKLLDIRKNEDKIHITSNDALWKGCGACTTTLTILSNGDVVPCAYINVPCGNIKDCEIEEIWKTDVFNKIRESKLKGKCGKCKYGFLCKGCRAVPFMEQNDYLEEDSGCWL